MRRRASLALVLLGAAAALGCLRPPPLLVEVSDGRYAMGTVLELSLIVPDRAAARASTALEAAFARAERLDALLSRYAPDSALNRLNASAGAGPVAVDPELRAVLEAAHEAGAATGGAFDVTVGPLIELWVEAAHGDKLPTEAALSAARRRVGVRRLRIDAGGRVSLEPGTTIDLGGIAKGFALDRIAAELRAAGFDRGLLSFGQSSIQALGRPPDAPGWRLLLRSPDEDFGGLVLLEDQALSVSSTLGQWSEVEGRRYGHVIDPRSGRPIERGRQAAVVAATAAEAEVLSTALLVLDESDGVDLVESTPGAEAFVLDEEGFAFASSGWSRATRFERLDRSPAD